MDRTETIIEAVGAISRKWTVEVADKLESGPQRYNQLLKEIDGQVTPKVFTRVLRRMEEHRIIDREMVDGSPPGVEYRLTDFGYELLAALDDLAKVWERH